MWDPFAIVPLWNIRGRSDNGSFANEGDQKHCRSSDSHLCVTLHWPESWYAHKRDAFNPTFFHGTMIPDKRDGAGTFYRRNRYYDPETGSFTQEDPIGLAGGINLYGFAGGDPLNFSDPFGLRVCIRGNSAKQVGRLASALEDATGTDITLDKGNCVSDFESVEEEGFEEVQKLFRKLVDARFEVGLQISDEYFAGSFFDRMSNTAKIDPDDIGASYLSPSKFLGCFFPTPGGRFALRALVAHELIGHGAGLVQIGRPFRQGRAIQVENIYHRERGEPRRCQ